MAQRIRGFGWKSEAAGRDLHVLPGHTTRALVPDLRVTLPNYAELDVQTYVTANPGVTLKFQPLFHAHPQGSAWAGLGLSVDAGTGAVTVLAAQPPLPKKNFIIEAILKTPERSFREVIRIQVHTSVARVWLTPLRLAVRIGSPPTGTRFTVRAEFDDGVVGDVTLNHGVAWSSPGRVTADGFLHPAPGDTPGAEFDVTAKLPASLGGQTTPKGTLRVAPAWTADPAVPQATLITGGSSPFLIPPERSPNVLILSSGFTDAQKPVFEAMSDLIVDKLRTDRLTRPYDLLVTSINFWRVFLPAGTPGLCCREEFYTTVDAAGRTIAHPMPPALPPPDLGEWKEVSHLLYVVGLPTPADAGKAPLTLRSEWGTLVRLDHAPLVTNPALVSDARIEEWQKLATRTSIDEIETFPPIAMGVPPAASVPASAMLRLHTDRGGKTALFDLLKQVTAADGTTLPGGLELGKLWIPLPEGAPPPPWRFDNTELQVVLSAYPGGRPLNSHPAIVMGTSPQRAVFLATKVPGRNAHTLVPIVPPGLANDAVRVVAHELAHSFGLGDEYQEFDERDPQYDDADLNWYSNLQYETAIRVGRTGPLKSAQIKWNWHRIRKATVVEGPIVPEAGGRFRVPVAPGHGFLFAAGDRVLLRVRKWGAVLGRQPIQTLAPAHEAQVVGPLSAAAVVITAAPGATLTAAHLAPFAAGSLLYAPVQAPASVRSAAYPYAEMIAKNIRDYIDTKNKPLTREPCELDREAVRAPILPGVSLKAGFCGLCLPQIVGLYSGGNRYACGVFHPAGECSMGPGGAFPELTRFCPVCRYVLVDAINPVLHGQLDEDYDVVYPQG